MQYKIKIVFPTTLILAMIILMFFKLTIYVNIAWWFVFLPLYIIPLLMSLVGVGLLSFYAFVFAFFGCSFLIVDFVTHVQHYWERRQWKKSQKTNV